MASLKISMAFVIATSLLQLSTGLKCRCHSYCESDVRDCYTRAGYTFGTVKTDEHTPRSILACNSEFSRCTSKCEPVCRNEL